MAAFYAKFGIFAADGGHSALFQDILVKNSDMIDYISKLIGGIIYLLIIVAIASFGIFSWQYDMDMIGAICLGIATIGLITPIVEFFNKIDKKREEALNKMHNIPERLDHEYGEQWGRKFQKLIGDATKSTTDPEKLQDLHDCSQTVQNISKWPIVGIGDEYYINSAFRYTGCHLKVTDETGKVISEIV